MSRTADRLLSVLRTGRTTRFLFGLHVLLMIASLWLFRNERSGDHFTYLGLAEGLRHGTFSYWTGEFAPPPMETYRTQGYPVFLLLVEALGDGTMPIKLAQLLLHGLLLLMLTRNLREHPEGVLAVNVLLLVMLFQLQLLYYTQVVFPEVLMAFLCTAVVLQARDGLRTQRQALVVGLVLALAWWVRPVLLLFPLLVMLGDLVLHRGAERRAMLRLNTLMTGVFIVLAPLPFGLWNLKHHGVFRPVPISGSAVISNLGLWQARLPGYGSMHYFQYSSFGWEAIPWVDPDAAARYYAEFQEQWRRIDSVAAPAMTTADRERLPLMRERHPELFPTRSASWTLALDKAIAQENRATILQEPGHYLLTRLYTAVRLWVSGVNLPIQRIVFEPGTNRRPVRKLPSSLMDWAKAVFPFVLTLLTFGTALVLVARSVWRHGRAWLNRRWALYLIGYVWLIHVPMSIQSRYTVPVHALLLACMALALADSVDRSHRNDALTTGRTQFRRTRPSDGTP